ncbi:MAG: hypothetical protein QM594_20895 [Niabella sp.]
MKVSEAFHKSLFWDVDPERLDWERNRQLIIERVFTRGVTQEVRRIYQVYSNEEIREAILKSKTFDKKTANYFSIKYQIPISRINVAPEYY